MATRKDIISLPDSRLRQKSKKADPTSKETQKLIVDMESATIDWEKHREHEIGVALAAVQLGKLERVIVIRNNFEDKQDNSFAVLINPKITKLEGDINEAHEGCLSVPNIYGMVPRHDKVRVRALNEEGKPISFKASGFLARVLQHEIDHTNGITFVDHIKDHDAFYKLTKEGNITKISYDKIRKNNILWK